MTKEEIPPRSEFPVPSSNIPAPRSNFSFLTPDFRTIAESAAKAEAHIMGDPRAACFHARFALEAVVHWLYRHDARLRMPYDPAPRGSAARAVLPEPAAASGLPEGPRE